MENFQAQVFNDFDERIASTDDPLGFADKNCAGADTTVHVYDASTNELAPIYDVNLDTLANGEAIPDPLTQPITCDESGTFSFYAPDGRYNVVINQGQGTLEKSWPDILIVDTFRVSQALGSFDPDIIEALEDTDRALELARDQLIAANTQLQIDVQNILVDTGGLHAETGSLNNRIDAMRIDMDAVISGGQAARQILTNAQLQLQNELEALNTLVDGENGLVWRITNVESVNATQATQITGLQTTQGDQLNRIVTQEQTTATHTQRLGELTTITNDTNASIESLEQTSEDQAQRIETLTASISNMDQTTNLLDTSTWILGQGANPDWILYGAPIENSRVRGMSPYGSATMWKGVSDGNSLNAGGFTKAVDLDGDNTYRFMVWMKRNSNEGEYRLSCQGTLQDLSGVDKPAPPFVHITGNELDALEITPNEWFLFVGHLHDVNYSGTNHVNTGIYNKDGVKVGNASDFKFKTNDTQSIDFHAQFRNAITGATVYFAEPRLEVLDSTQLPLIDLLDISDGRFTEFRSSIESLEDVTSSTASRTDQLETKQGQHNTRITNQESTTGQHASKLTQLEAKDGVHTSQISTLNTVTGEQATRLTELSTADQDLSSRIGVQETTTSGHASRLSQIESTNGEQGSKLTTLETASLDHGERITGVETTSGSNTSRISQQELTTQTHASKLESIRFTNKSTARITGLDTEDYTATRAGEEIGDSITFGSDVEDGVLISGGSRKLYSKSFIKVNTDNTYKVRIVVKHTVESTGSPSRAYVGLSCLDSNFDFIQGSSGNTSVYCAVKAELMVDDGQWHTYEGTITGISTTNPNSETDKFSQGTVYVRAMALLHNGGNSASKSIVKSLELWDVTDSIDLEDQFDSRYDSLVTVDQNQATRLNSLEFTRNDHSSRISAQESVTNGQATRIGTLETNDNSSRSRIGTLETTTSNTASRTTTLESEQGSLKSRVSTQESVTGNHASQLSTLTTKSNNATSEINSLNTTTDSLASRISNTEFVTTDMLANSLSLVANTNTSIQLNITEANAHTVNFESEFSGKALVRARINDAEGGIRIKLNDVVIGSPTSSNDDTKWFNYIVDVVTGTNTLKFYAAHSDGALLLSLLVNGGNVGNAVAQIITVNAEQATLIDEIKAAADGLESRVVTEESATINHASRLGVIETKQGTDGSRIGSLETTRTDHASRIGSVETVQGNLASRIGTEESTSSAHATQLTTLTNTSNSHTSQITAIQTVNSQQATSITNLGVTIGNQAASTLDEAKVYTDQETQALRATRVIQANSNGVVAGIGLMADSTLGSSIYFSADMIAIVPPNWNPANQSQKILPFVYDAIYGRVILDKATIVDLTADTIVGGSLAVDTLTCNTRDVNFVSGTIKGHMLDPDFASGLVRIDPDAERLGGITTNSYNGKAADNYRLKCPVLKSGGSKIKFNVNLVSGKFSAGSPKHVFFKIRVNDIYCRVYQQGPNLIITENNNDQSEINAWSVDASNGKQKFNVNYNYIYENAIEGEDYVFEIQFTDFHNTASYYASLTTSITADEPTKSSGGVIADIHWSDIIGAPLLAQTDVDNVWSVAQTMSTLKIGASGKIQGKDNKTIVQDHNNGHVTLSATGDHLYLGYQNTTAVRLDSKMIVGTSTNVISTSGKLYDEGTALTSKYLAIGAKAADADKLDGLNSSQFIRRDTNQTVSGKLFLGGSEINPGSGAALQVNGFMRTGNIYLHEGGNSPNTPEGIIGNTSGNLTWKSDKVWTEGNDTLLGRLDKAKTWTSRQTFNSLTDNTTGIGTTETTLVTLSSGQWAKPIGYSSMIRTTSVGIPSNKTGTYAYWNVLSRRDTAGGYVGLLSPYPGSHDLFIGTASTSTQNPTWDQVWTSGSDGAGSGLDADLLDGFQGHQYLRSDANDTMNAALTVTGGVTSTNNNNGFTADSAAHANFVMDRGSISYDNNILFKTSGALDWRIWQGGSKDILAIRKESHAADLVIFKTDGLYMADTKSVFLGDGRSSLSGAGAHASFNSVGNITIQADSDKASSSEKLTLAAGHNKITINGGALGNVALKYNDHTVWHAGNDGAGSGLDADKLDGLNSTQFLRSDASDVTTGQLSIHKTGIGLLVGGGVTDGNDTSIYIGNGNGTSSGYGYHINYYGSGSGNTNAFEIKSLNNGVAGKSLLRSNIDGIINFGQLGAKIAGNLIWHAGNDGAGSGLDADLLDGLQSTSYFKNNDSSTGNYSTTGAIVSGRGSGGVSLTINDGHGNASVAFNHGNGRPEQNGNAARIEVNTDESNEAKMMFEVMSSVTAGVNTSMIPVLTIRPSLVSSAQQMEVLSTNSNQALHVKGGIRSDKRFFDNNPTGEGGLVGNYTDQSSADKIIWTIGTSWMTHAKHYGLGYHRGAENMSTQHQIVVKDNGSTGIRLGMLGDAWFKKSINAPVIKENSINIADKYLNVNQLSYNSPDSWAAAFTAVDQFKEWVTSGDADHSSYSTITDSIATGFINSIIGQFNTVIADKANIGYLSSRSIEVTGRQKLINNVTSSGHLDGWFTGGTSDYTEYRNRTYLTDANISNGLQVNGLPVTTLKVANTGGGTFAHDPIEVDHNAIYEIRMAFYATGTTQSGRRYIGILASDEGGDGDDLGKHNVEVYNATTRVKGTDNDNFYAITSTAWKSLVHVVFYVVGANANVDDVPETNRSIAKLKSNSKFLTVRFLNWDNGSNNNSMHIYNPSVREVNTGQIVAHNIAANTITAGNIAANAITTSELASNSVQSIHIVSGTIEAGDIKSNTITATQIAANAITTSELAANSVTSDNIVAGTIQASDIKANTITAGQIASNAITTNELAAQAVEAVNIKAGVITSNHIATGSIVAEDIKTNAITAVQIAADAITSSELKANSVTSGHIVAGTIQASDIKANTITAGQIAANAITTSELAANSVNATHIVASSITAVEIAANAITATQLAVNTVSASHIVGETITASEIAYRTLTGDLISTNTLEARSIKAQSITTTKLAVGTTENSFPDYDMLDDDYYEIGTTGSNFTLVATGNTTSGIKRIRIPSSTTQDNNIRSGKFTLESSTDYNASVRAYSEGSIRTVDVYVQEGTHNASGTITWGSLRQVASAQTTSQQKFDVNFKTGSNTRVGRMVMVTRENSGTSAYGTVTSIVVRKRLTGSLIVDGSITANHIDVGSIGVENLSWAYGSFGSTSVNVEGTTNLTTRFFSTGTGSSSLAGAFTNADNNSHSLFAGHSYNKSDSDTFLQVPAAALKVTTKGAKGVDVNSDNGTAGRFLNSTSNGGNPTIMVENASSSANAIAIHSRGKLLVRNYHQNGIGIDAWGINHIKGQNGAGGFSMDGGGITTFRQDVKIDDSRNLYMYSGNNTYMKMNARDEGTECILHIHGVNTSGSATPGRIAIYGGSRYAYLETVSAGVIRHRTDWGYAEIGPRNGSWMHFQTDRSSFYMYKPLAVQGDVTFFYSDKRLKDVQKILDPKQSLNNLLKWEAVQYIPNETAIGYGFENTLQIGLLAQQIEEDYPELTPLAPFDQEERGVSASGENYKTLKYERTVAVLVSALQGEVQERTKLEEKLAEQEQKLAEMERKLNVVMGMLK